MKMKAEIMGDIWGGVPNGPGIMIEAEHQSGIELWEAAVRVASCLQTKGVGQGARVLITGSTDHRTISSFMGAVLAGAAPCLVAPPMLSGRMSEKQLLAAVSACDPRIAISWDDTFEGLDLEVIDFSSTMQYEPVEPVQARADDIHHIQLTSGSTSRPKAVLLTHNNVQSNIEALVVSSGVDSSTRLVSWLPLYHDMGLMQVLAGLRYGLPVTLMQPTSYLRKPLDWIALLSQDRATHTAVPPFALRACVRSARALGIAEEIDLSSLSQVYVGAEPIPPAFLNDFIETFKSKGLDPSVITPSYGLAESVLAVTIAAPRGVSEYGTRIRTQVVPEQGENVFQINYEKEVVSCGCPVQGMEVRIVGLDGETVPERSVGRVLIRGTSLSPGYLGEDRVENSVGWRETGDLGFLDQGELYITGREKEIVIVRGRNYMPYDIEEVIESHRLVGGGHSIVTNVTVPSGEEYLVALVESKIPVEEHQELVDDIKLAVRTELGLTLQYVHVLPRGQLPKTTSGKRQRLFARKLFEQAM